MGALSRREIIGALVAAAAMPASVRAAPAVRVSALDSPRFPANAPGLRSFVNAVRGAGVIGLGEATHGSRELFALKSAMIEALMRARRLGAIGFEVGAAVILPLDEYVRRGQPIDVAATLKSSGNYTIATTELATLIETIRRINGNRPTADRIQIFGYDVQTPGADAAEIIRFCAAFGQNPNFPAEFRELALSPKPIQALSPMAVPAIVAALPAARAAYVAVREPLLNAAGPAAVDARLQLFDMIDRSFALFREPSFVAAYAKRDFYGATRIEEVARGARGAVAVWAHNGHINRVSYEFPQGKLLGGELASRFGARYFAVGTAFYEGQTRALRKGAAGAIVNTMGAAEAGSLDESLAGLGSSYFVTMDELAKVDGWSDRVRTRGVLRAIGGGYEPENRSRTYRDTCLVDQYDAIAFVRTLSASNPLA